MKVVLLGASGNAGREIARLLGASLTSDDEVVLAGRDPEKLAVTRAVVSSPARVRVSVVDVARSAEVRDVVAGAGLVVVTVSRPDLVREIARIVLEAGADWFDTLLSTEEKWDGLRALEPEIVRRGRCFVTDGGFHPGLPAALVRWAGCQLDELTAADVVGAMRMDWRADTLAESTISEMVDEFTHFDMTTWVEGERRKLRWSQCPTIDFGPPIGKKSCVPMPLMEMDALPTMFPRLRRCGFYIGGFSPAMDYLALPSLTLMSKVPALRSATLRLTRWSMGRLASYPPPHRLAVRMDARGTLNGGPATATVSVGGDDGYLLTAAPAVSCIRGVLDGSIRAPGLHLQAHLVDPELLLAELSAFGLEVETRVQPASAISRATQHTR